MIAAVGDLGVTSLGVEDVLRALRTYGRVWVDVDPESFVCVVEAGEEREVGRGHTVLSAALACWVGVLEEFSEYTGRGVADLERFLLGPDIA